MAASDQATNDPIIAPTRAKLFDVECRVNALCDEFEKLPPRQQRKRRNEFGSRGAALADEQAALIEQFRIDAVAPDGRPLRGDDDDDDSI